MLRPYFLLPLRVDRLASKPIALDNCFAMYIINSLDIELIIW